MKVYMTTDLEGVSGVTQVTQSFSDKHRYEEARISLTRDVNAAVLGARDAGATDIIVLDGHGGNAGYNFVYEELVDGARYQLGAPRTTYSEGLTFDTHCVFAVGYHAMAGTRAAVLDHTQSSMSIVNIWLNGEPIGELAMEAYVAGHYGVPVALVTGDDKVCAEAKQLLGDEVVTACVKWTAKRQSALCLPPGEARAVIREKAAEAVKAADRIEPLTIQSPVELRVQYLRTEMCERFWGRPDVEMPDSRTVVFRGDNALEVMNAYCGY
ncbi:MAG: M55 family metallopeptidase [Armatimonadota bacterium]